MYNDILNFTIPEEAILMGYADDIALVVVKDAEVISIFNGWLGSSCSLQPHFGEWHFRLQLTLIN